MCAARPRPGPFRDIGGRGDGAPRYPARDRGTFCSSGGDRRRDTVVRPDRNGRQLFINMYIDQMSYDRSLLGAATLYAGGTDLKDPCLSPTYWLFADFPPVLLVSGTCDLFLSNTARVDRKLRDAGRESAMIVYEGQNTRHVWPGPTFPKRGPG